MADPDPTGAGGLLDGGSTVPDASAPDAASVGPDTGRGGEDGGTTPTPDGGSALTSDTAAMLVPPDAAAPMLAVCTGVSCGNGSCIVREGQAACSCAPHVIGAACDTCARGYTGRDCKTCAGGYVDDGAGGCMLDPCSAVSCQNQGTCVLGAAGPACECRPQFTGPSCERCAPGHTGGDCQQCLPGFQRRDGVCVEDACFGVSCGVGGACKVVDAKATCACKTGYTGATCEACDTGYVRSRLGTCTNTLPSVRAPILIWFDGSATGTMDILPNGDVKTWRNRHDPDKKAWGWFQNDARLPRHSPETRGVVFDGDVMVSFSNLPGQGQHYTMFTVARWNAGAGSQVIMSFRETSDGYEGKGLSVNGTKARFVHRAPPAPSGGDELEADLFGAGGPAKLVIAKRVPFGIGTAHVLSNGAQTSVLPAKSLGTVPPLYTVMGMEQPSVKEPSALRGTIHEVLMFDGALTSEEEKAVIAYLKVRWGL